MGALFCFGLLLYALVLAPRVRVPSTRGGGSRLVRCRAELAWLLWGLYLALGFSAMLINLSDVFVTVYPPNEWATLLLLACIVVSIHGFRHFEARDLAVLVSRPLNGQRGLENFLLVVQAGSIAFFTPFALQSLTGDANINRLELAAKMEVLGSYGLINTFAGMASHLFVATLVLAFLRMSQPRHRNQGARAVALVVASLSYVIYVLAYVGRDGVVYWGMTALAVYVVFQPHLDKRMRQRIRRTGAVLVALLLIPFAVITIERFAYSDAGAAWSILDYFGRQLQTFSDYASIERPMTMGAMNFPKFVEAGCAAAGLECPRWEDIRELVFEQYLAQDKEPWLFATFVSDFAGDFGLVGAAVAVALIALSAQRLCVRSRRGRPMTLARLMGILLLFLVPFWGVFYFRFSIINVFIVVNLVFIGAVAWLEQRRQRVGSEAEGVVDASRRTAT